MSEFINHNILGRIPDEWKISKFDEVADIIHGHQFRTNDFTKEGIKVFKITQIQGDATIDLTKCDFIDSQRLNDFKKYLIKHNDILMALTGATIGKIARFKSSELALQNYRVGKFVSKNENILFTDYLYYFLSSKLFFNQLLSRQTQSAQQNIGKEDICNMSICFPSINLQKIIAKILTSLDDKIELNNKINQELESLAKLLFKRWFVDFEFPNENGELYKSTGGEMVDSDLGEIPKMWVVESLDNIAEYLNGLALQKFPPESEYKFLPVIKIKELRHKDTSNSDKASVNIPEKYIIKDGDVLFSWSGSLMIDFWTNGKGALNQHLFKVTSNIYPKWYYYLWTKHHLTEFIKIAESKATTMGHIQRQHLTNAKVLVPNEDIFALISPIIEPTISKIIANRIENTELIKLRDTLLPKLISGELEIKEN
jgi:type I restriction enzyme S subunit